MIFINTLEKLNSKIKEQMDERLYLFEKFEAVYLFGSVLNANNAYNDIDILLVYQYYSEEIRKQVDIIEEELKTVYGPVIDLTVLSTDENNEIAFLERLKLKYLKVK